MSGFCITKKCVLVHVKNIITEVPFKSNFIVIELLYICVVGYIIRKFNIIATDLVIPPLPN